MNKLLPVFRKKYVMIERTVINEPNMEVFAGVLQGVGKRERQEDSFYLSDYTDKETVEKKGVLAVVADGMGGLANGNLISNQIVVTAKECFENACYHENDNKQDEVDFLLSMLHRIDEKTKYLQEELNETECGSTLIVVLVHGNKLFFLSVGDSHIYLLRDNKLFLLNSEHNQNSRLMDKVAEGVISVDQYRDIMGKSAITSFIGIEELELYDVSYRPLELKKDDYILLMSDGVFGTLSDRQLLELKQENAADYAAAIAQAVECSARPKQDNYTAIILKCEG